MRWEEKIAPQSWGQCQAECPHYDFSPLPFSTFRESLPFLVPEVGQVRAYLGRGPADRIPEGGLQDGGVVSGPWKLSQDWGELSSRVWVLSWTLSVGGAVAPPPQLCLGLCQIGFLGAWSLCEAELFPGPSQAALGAGTA